MEKRNSELKSKGPGIEAPIFQTTAQNLTPAALLKRVKEVRMALEEWKKVTSKPKSSYMSVNKVSHPAPETQLLATSYVNHLSQAQDALLEASHKLKTAIVAPQLTYVLRR
jgi:hypothetical protein